MMIFMLAAVIVSGPVTGGDRGQAFGATPAADLARAGYTENEFFVAGTASSTAEPMPALRSQRPARHAISASCSAERGCSTTRR